MEDLVRHIGTQISTINRKTNCRALTVVPRTNDSSSDNYSGALIGAMLKS